MTQKTTLKQWDMVTMHTLVTVSSGCRADSGQAGPGCALAVRGNVTTYSSSPAPILSSP